MAASKPLTARQRLHVRLDQIRTTLHDVERALAAHKDRDAFRELTFLRALAVGAHVELEGLATPPLEARTYHPRYAPVDDAPPDAD